MGPEFTTASSGLQESQGSGTLEAVPPEQPTVPDPALTAQLWDAPVSVRLSTAVVKDGGDNEPIAFFIVMIDRDGKVLGSHPMESFEEVVVVAGRLVRDAAKVWPVSAKKLKLDKA